MGLPMRINGLRGTTVVCLPDSGSEKNVISIDAAATLGLNINRDVCHQRAFTMGNGKLIKALGCTEPTECFFAKDPGPALSYTFYIFWRLITPLIMGMSFLKSTEILSKYRYRLQLQASISRGLIRSYGISSSKQRLLCAINSQPVLVSADTGSDVGLISLAYVNERSLSMTCYKSDECAIQFADRSVSSLCGEVDVPIVVSGPSRYTF